MKVQYHHFNKREVHNFTIETNDDIYNVTVSLDENGKFCDHTIFSSTGRQLGNEGTDGEIVESILDHLDENWQAIVN